MNLHNIKLEHGHFGLWSFLYDSHWKVVNENLYRKEYKENMILKNTFFYKSVAHEVQS